MKLACIVLGVARVFSPPMNYFLVQPENKLVHLPDCSITEGQRDLIQVHQIGGPPVFARGRKRPDLCVFTVPKGASLESPCLIVDESGLVREVLASRTSTNAVTFIAAGVVDQQYDAPHLEEARKAVAAKIKELNPGKAATPKAPARDLDAIFKRLTKLKPTKRATAVNSIKAMFQFDAPINDEEANKILEALRRRGNLTIDANDKLQIRNA